MANSEASDRGAREVLEDVFARASRVASPLVKQDCYLVDGELKKWDGPMQTVNSPMYRQVAGGLEPVILGHYPQLTGNESLEVLAAATAAYDQGRGFWPMLSLRGRCSYLTVLADEMEKVREEVVDLLMWEIGKSLADSIKEFDRTVKYIRDTVAAAYELEFASDDFVETEGVTAQIRRVPLGVVLCMGPFNYPLNETFTTLIPALIMGNTVIMKPPKIGVLLHNPLLRIFKEVFPRGVINTVYGDGQTIINPLLASGKIDCLAFIGTSRVADLLKKSSPNPHRLRSILGLEAKNPAIILPAANLDTAVSECLAGSLSYNGQRCTALKIIFVHRSIADNFCAKFAAAVEQLKIGPPWDVSVSITPLPEEHKTASMTELIEDAKAQGAAVINRHGGEFIESLMVPAVVYPVKAGMRLYDEEQFGPVVPIVVFDDIEETLEYVRNSKYGQQASVFGQNPQSLSYMIDQLANQVCRININCQCQRGPDNYPFTGRKDSAEGTLSLTDALRVFSIRSLVATNAKSRPLFEFIAHHGGSTFLSVE